MTTDALVLAGGGVAGIAWETGVLLGLQDEDPRIADRLTAETTRYVGTSAGLTVAAQLTRDGREPARSRLPGSGRCGWTPTRPQRGGEGRDALGLTSDGRQ